MAQSQRDPAQEHHPGSPPREAPSSKHGDLDYVDVDQGLKESVERGPLTDGAKQGSPEKNKEAGTGFDNTN